MVLFSKDLFIIIVLVLPFLHVLSAATPQSKDCVKVGSILLLFCGQAATRSWISMVVGHECCPELRQGSHKAMWARVSSLLCDHI